MAPNDVRAIDKRAVVTTRKEEMQVLCLGLSRTGTTSLITALRILGYKSYHFTEIYNHKGHLFCWLEGINIKLTGNGKAYTRVEFDKLLDEYSAISDAPCVNFPDELVAAYPNAKVVLTTRDTEPWVKSIEKSYYLILSWRIWSLLSMLNRPLGALHDLLQIILTDWTAGNWQDRTALREGAKRHNDHVRSIVPKDNLLEFRVQEGWEPLCKFLGKPVPDEPFPHVNEGKASANTLKRAIVYLLVANFMIKLIRIVKATALPVAVAGLGWVAWQYGWTTGRIE